MSYPSASPRRAPLTVAECKSLGRPSGHGRFLRITDVVATIGVSRSTIYRMVEAGTFPEQTRLTAQTVGWRRFAARCTCARSQTTAPILSAPCVRCAARVERCSASAVATLSTSLTTVRTHDSNGAVSLARRHDRWRDRAGESRRADDGAGGRDHLAAADLLRRLPDDLGGHVRLTETRREGTRDRPGRLGRGERAALSRSGELARHARVPASGFAAGALLLVR